MTIQPIVEGHGDVEAVPALLRRLVAEASYPDITILKPIRAKRAELVTAASLDRWIQLARTRNPQAILILFDGDDDCPAELAPVVKQFATASAAPIPCEVVVAQREYESWFLGSMESLRGFGGISEQAQSHAEPERPRDAKGEVDLRMITGRFYVERTDQVALTTAFEFQSAYRACRSFRKMVKVFGDLAIAGGATLENWPPADW
jgi:Domain of unknown function (DUF4276)